MPIALEGNYRKSGQLVQRFRECREADVFGPRLPRVDPSDRPVDGAFVRRQLNLLRNDRFEAEKRFGNHFQFRASYTYGKALDDVTDFSGGLDSLT